MRRKMNNTEIQSRWIELQQELQSDPVGFARRTIEASQLIGDMAYVDTSQRQQEATQAFNSLVARRINKWKTKLPFITQNFTPWHIGTVKTLTGILIAGLINVPNWWYLQLEICIMSTKN